MATRNSSTRKRETRDLASLVPFPTQDVVFPSCTEEEDLALAEDIKANGLRLLIHVLPENSAGFEENTILFGHRRRAALMRIGKRKANVIVRYDLADADAETIELLFIDDNDQRRQLSKLGRARVALRRFEIERSREPGELSEREERDARDRVGLAIGMSGRNLQRYWNVLKAPLSIQRAFEMEQFGLKEAEAIGRLPNNVQSEIDQRLTAGGEPKKIVNQYLGSQSRQAKKRGTGCSRFLTHLQKADRELDGFDLEDLNFKPRGAELEILHRVEKRCAELIRACKRSAQEEKSVMKKIRRRSRG
jgi:ParB-like chromosome segregation protein Spo0J